MSYDVASRVVTVDHADGREVLHESVLDYCRRELARLRADAPELPFDFTGGFAGYFGYELKADLGGELVHRSPLPDATLLFCDRVIAFDHHKQRVHLVALADAAGAPAAEAWLTATEAELEAIARRPPPRAARARGRRAALRRPRGPRGLPRQHRGLQARDLRGREL